jgi:hypothetical protein
MKPVVVKHSHPICFQVHSCEAFPVDVRLRSAHTSGLLPFFQITSILLHMCVRACMQVFAATDETVAYSEHH